MSSEGERQTAKKRQKTIQYRLPMEALTRMISFLDFGELLLFRAMNTDMKQLANEILRKRSTVPQKLKFRSFRTKVGDMEFALKRGFTTQLASLVSTAMYTLKKGSLCHFLDDEDMASNADRLCRIGNYSSDTSLDVDEGGDFLEWSAYVEFEEHCSPSAAIQKLGMLFESLEQKHKAKFDERRSMYVFDRPDDEVKAERDNEAANIRSLKHTCFSLLYSSSSIGLSRSEWKQSYALSHREYETFVVAIRLDNEMEIKISEEMRFVASYDWDY